MYRHFTVVTVLLTAILAMFAGGETRQSQAAPTARATPARPAAPTIVAADHAVPQAPGWWGVESHSDGDTAAASSVPPSGDGFDGTEVPGYSPEYLASLSEEERELLLA